MPQERRHFVRVGFDAPALLATATAAFSVHVLDLSLKGALIMMPAQAALGRGTLCQLTIPLADTGNHIAMSTEVCQKVTTGSQRIASRTSSPRSSSSQSGRVSIRSGDTT